MSLSCFSRTVAFIAMTLVIATAALAQPRSAPGGFATVQKTGATHGMFLTSDFPGRQIRLGPPPGRDTSAVTKSDIQTRTNRPVRIGFEREPGETDRTIRLADLPWQTLVDGGIAARLTVTSETAA